MSRIGEEEAVIMGVKVEFLGLLPKELRPTVFQAFWLLVSRNVRDLSGFS